MSFITSGLKLFAEKQALWPPWAIQVILKTIYLFCLSANAMGQTQQTDWDHVLPQCETPWGLSLWGNTCKVNWCSRKDPDRGKCKGLPFNGVKDEERLKGAEHLQVEGDQGGPIRTLSATTMGRWILRATSRRLSPVSIFLKCFLFHLIGGMSGSLKPL